MRRDLSKPLPVGGQANGAALRGSDVLEHGRNLWRGRSSRDTHPGDYIRLTDTNGPLIVSLRTCYAPRGILLSARRTILVLLPDKIGGVQQDIWDGGQAAHLCPSSVGRQGPPADLSELSAEGAGSVRFRPRRYRQHRLWRPAPHGPRKIRRGMREDLKLRRRGRVPESGSRGSQAGRALRWAASCRGRYPLRPSAGGVLSIAESRT